jgi:hypothetical protein
MIIYMDGELRITLAALAHSLAGGEIEAALPLEEPSLLAITVSVGIRSSRNSGEWDWNGTYETPPNEPTARG